MFGALRYSIYNFIRNKQVREAYLDHLGNVSSGNQSYIEDTLYYEELSVALSTTIEKLPEKYKNVYLLSRNDNLTYKEIAKYLSIPLDTVEKHMGKALKMIRENLRGFTILICIWFADYWN